MVSSANIPEMQYIALQYIFSTPLCKYIYFISLAIYSSSFPFCSVLHSIVPPPSFRGCKSLGKVQSMTGVLLLLPQLFVSAVQMKRLVKVEISMEL